MKEVRKKKNIFSKIKTVLIYLILVILVKDLLYTFVIFRVYVEGDSMNNTLKANEKLWVCRLFSIDFEDIVVAEVNGKLIVKRCIGVPGDTLTFKNCEVYRNNEKLIETYAKGNTSSGSSSITLGEDEYFLLGDNREVSKDSRHFGCVSGSDILGEVVGK